MEIKSLATVVYMCIRYAVFVLFEVGLLLPLPNSLLQSSLELIEAQEQDQMFMRLLTLLVLTCPLFKSNKKLFSGHIPLWSCTLHKEKRKK